MKRKTKIILLLVVALFVVGLISTFLLWNKPHVNVENADGIKVSAVELYNIYQNDSTKANATYTNNIVEVSGQVTQINHNQQNQTVILLKTNIQDASVNCTMEEKPGNISVGSTVALKGICNGYVSGDADLGIPGDVILVRCYVSN